MYSGYRCRDSRRLRHHQQREPTIYDLHSFAASTLWSKQLGIPTRALTSRPFLALYTNDALIRIALRHCTKCVCFLLFFGATDSSVWGRLISHRQQVSQASFSSLNGGFDCILYEQSDGWNGWVGTFATAHTAQLFFYSFYSTIISQNVFL